MIVSIDWSTVRAGKLGELQVAMKGLVDFVDANEPRPLAYHVYFNEDATTMAVFQVHPDSASMEYHMEVAAPEFAKVKDLLELSAIEIYGDASDKLLGQLRKKAQLLGGATLAAHDLHAGFTRFTVR